MTMDTADPVSADVLRGDVERVVVPREQIARRVDEIAREITDCYDGEDLTVVAVLPGSLIFLADLMRRLPLRLHVDVVSICSYPGGATVSRGPRFDLPVASDLAGRQVLIVDDILDSARTLGALRTEIRAVGPASLRACVLLQKDRPDLGDRAAAEFVGFHLPDEFIVGYGLDFDGLYRNLPDLCVLKPHVLAAGRTTPGVGE